MKIGINVPLTGFAAADGKSALDGAKLAVADANAKGGINGEKIELVIYDDQASPKEATPAATKLIEKDKVVVGRVRLVLGVDPRRRSACSRRQRCPTWSRIPSTRT